MADLVEIDGCEIKPWTPSGFGRFIGPCRPTYTVAELADIFSLLSDPSRLRLLASLLEGGELCVCNLALRE